jgi:enolase
MAANVGDEGGFSPPLSRFEDALDLLVSAIEVRQPDDLAIAPAVHTLSASSVAESTSSRTSGQCSFAKYALP